MPFTYLNTISNCDLYWLQIRYFVETGVFFFVYVYDGVGICVYDGGSGYNGVCVCVYGGGSGYDGVCVCVYDGGSAIPLWSVSVWPSSCQCRSSAAIFWETCLISRLTTSHSCSWRKDDRPAPAYLVGRLP